MQVPTIMNFRARLRKYGYTMISIKRCKLFDDPVFYVKALEPLAGFRVSRYMTIDDMFLWR